MTPFWITLAIAAVVGLLVWGGIVAARLRRERVAAFRRLARDLGLEFDERRFGTLHERYPQFAVFQRGDDREAFDTLRGELELFGRPCRVLAGEFEYETEDSDGDTTTHEFSYLLVHLPFATPSLELRREHFFDKVAAAIGFDDIDFESQEFSRRYHVRASDKRFAYDVMHPRMMEFLLAAQVDAFELHDGVLCVTDGHRTWSPAGFRARIGFVRSLCERWPRHLLVD